MIEDGTYGIVSRYVAGHRWPEMMGDGVAEEITKAVRRQAKRWGVDVLGVQVSDLTRSRSYRLISGVKATGG